MKRERNKEELFLRENKNILSKENRNLGEKLIFFIKNKCNQTHPKRLA